MRLRRSKRRLVGEGIELKRTYSLTGLCVYRWMVFLRFRHTSKNHQCHFDMRTAFKLEMSIHSIWTNPMIVRERK